MEPDEYFDVMELVDKISTKEESDDMHHSVFTIPRYWRETAQEEVYAN